MRVKPHILNVASTATLRKIAEDFELSVNDKRKRQSLIDAISSARRCQPADLLGYLGGPEVKQICEAAGVDSRGRRNALITRLLDAASPAPKPVPAPALRRQSNTRPKTFNHSPKITTMSDQKPAQANLQLAANEAGTTNVEKYEFEPIKGYPMLNWRGKRPFTSTQYFPAQLKEVHGDEVEGWRNKILWGDNLQVMSHLLKEFRGKVDLIYIDPPFDSKADYKRTIELKGHKTESQRSTFEEKQYSDIWTNDEYLQFMYERLVMCRELLKPTGSIYVHLDWHVVHQIRCILDEVFGTGAASGTDGHPGFRNEVIWCYAGGGIPTSEMPRKHDNLLWYTRGSDWTFNPQYRPYSEGTVQRGRTAVKGDNAELRAEGTPINDWWSDVKKITSPTDPEKLYYPTQKSEELLSRIVEMHSNRGDLVFDCFMGSGTTQAVALKTGRRYIGADINLGAIQTTTKRLIKAAGELRHDAKRAAEVNYTGFEIYNVNHYDIFRNPAQAKDLLLEALEVQKLDMSSVFDGEKDGRMVKIMPVNRIATRADLNELIAGFDYKAWERRQGESPNRAVEKITLVCMGHEPDLKAQLEFAAKPFKVDVEVVDILRDKADLEFKRDSEAKVAVKKGELVIERFFPMNLLQKLSLQKEAVEDWRELVESVLIDWNYDGAVLQPAVVDIPAKDELVKGAYKVPDDAGTIRVKITDLLSESWEGSVSHG
jgi:adenine-specific DNA-methyltransferase